MHVRIPSRRLDQGVALVVVLVFLSVSFMMIAGVLGWSMTSGRLTQRRIEYEQTLAAAEAATEKVIAKAQDDFLMGGSNAVAANLSGYVGLVPTEWTDWAAYEFRDPGGTLNQAYATLSSWGSDPLRWKYTTNITADTAILRTISNARLSGSVFGVEAGLMQEVQLAAIPLSSFMYFYNVVMELHPWHTWTNNGPVFCATNAYFCPTANLVFQDDVLCAGQILFTNAPGDPEARTLVPPTFLKSHDTKVGSVNFAGNIDPHAIIEPPPGGESSSSLLGQMRLYNKADLIILATNGGFQVFNPGTGQVAPTNLWMNFVTNHGNLYDRREEKWVNAIEINVGNLVNSATTATLRTSVSWPNAGTSVPVVYVDDQRSQPAGTLNSVKLVNGRTLPDGLVVATQDPVYVQGHYNYPASPGTPKQALISGDAIILLSRYWSDGNSSLDLGYRLAGHSTFNFGAVTGIVPTTTGLSSGGVLNAFRLLEDWSGDTLTFNGGLAVLFASQRATATWHGTVWSAYAAPATRVLRHNTTIYSSALANRLNLRVHRVIRTRWEPVMAGVVPP